MKDSADKDTATKLNTQLNKSMALMENVEDISSQQYKSNSKSIKINTMVQQSSATQSPIVKSRKSILKKSPNVCSQTLKNGEVTKINSNAENLKNVRPDKLISSILDSSRPHNLKELVQNETLDIESISSESFNLDDISDSEEIWIMDIPKSVDPCDLHGKKIIIGDKSKIKINNERYSTVTHNTECNISFVLNIGKETPQYKTVNIKPTGSLTLKRKLSGAQKAEAISSKNTELPLFVDHLKIRHPLFGVAYDGKLRRKLKKYSSPKKNRM